MHLFHTVPGRAAAFGLAIFGTICHTKKRSDIFPDVKYFIPRGNVDCRAVAVHAQFRISHRDRILLGHHLAIPQIKTRQETLYSNAAIALFWYFVHVILLRTLRARNNRPLYLLLGPLSRENIRLEGRGDDYGGMMLVAFSRSTGLPN